MNRKYHNGFISAMGVVVLGSFSLSCYKTDAQTTTPDGNENSDYVEIPEEILPENMKWVNKCDFDTKTIRFSVAGGVKYSVVDNPTTDGVNKSKKCGKAVTGGVKWELLYSSVLPRKFDFTAYKPIFKMQVKAPGKGAKVFFKLEPQNLGGSNPRPVEVTDIVTKKSGEWEELIFDFTDLQPQSNVYNKIVILFSAGDTTVGEEWYFDNILCPCEDLSEICLFQRYVNNPILEPQGPPSWKNLHMANAAVLSPANSPDGNWWMYLRGTGDEESYKDQIGLFTQSAKDFKPLGPWEEYPKNPVIPVGVPGSFDDTFLLDTAPVVGKDGVVYVYYNGKNRDRSKTGLCVRYSTDGGYTFRGIDEPLLPGYGCSDAVYHDGKYYIFYGGGNPCRLYVRITENPLSLKGCKAIPTIPLGEGPSNFDSKAVNGSMIFRLSGVDKWFATYQGSASHYDFPDRFHVAMSDDLIHWTKVKNNRPLFSRGDIGQWDQGGIWFPEIFEYEETLYMYYEGWGHKGYIADRDKPYFQPGHSCVGAAAVSKDEFLKWCGLK